MSTKMNQLTGDDALHPYARSRGMTPDKVTHGDAAFRRRPQARDAEQPADDVDSTTPVGRRQIDEVNHLEHRPVTRSLGKDEFFEIEKTHQAMGSTDKEKVASLGPLQNLDGVETNEALTGGKTSSLAETTAHDDGALIEQPLAHPRSIDDGWLRNLGRDVVDENEQVRAEERGGNEADEDSHEWVSVRKRKSEGRGRPSDHSVRRRYFRGRIDRTFQRTPETGISELREIRLSGGASTPEPSPATTRCGPN